MESKLNFENLKQQVNNLLQSIKIIPNPEKIEALQFILTSVYKSISSLDGTIDKKHPSENQLSELDDDSILSSGFENNSSPESHHCNLDSEILENKINNILPFNGKGHIVLPSKISKKDLIVNFKEVYSKFKLFKQSTISIASIKDLLQINTEGLIFKENIFCLKDNSTVEDIIPEIPPDPVTVPNEICTIILPPPHQPPITTPSPTVSDNLIIKNEPENIILKESSIIQNQYDEILSKTLKVKLENVLNWSVCDNGTIINENISCIKSNDLFNLKESLKICNETNLIKTDEDMSEENSLTNWIENGDGSSINSIPNLEEEITAEGETIIKLKRPTYKCFKCNKVYRKRKSLALHLSKSHAGFCAECHQYIGTTVLEIMTHNRTVHITEHPFVCEECGENFSRNQQYQTHLEVHRNKKLKFKKEKPKKIYDCNLCESNVVFDSLKLFKSHMEEQHKTEGFVCEQCGAYFNKSANLKQHESRKHRNQSSFACPHCQKNFSLKSNLKRHILLHTEVKKSFICDQCGQAYFTKMALKEHFNIVHSDVPKSECKICDKTFFTERALQWHESAHSESRPFKCVECPQAYKNASNLARHKKSTHKKDPDPKKVQRLVPNEQGELVPLQEEKPSPKIRKKRKEKNSQNHFASMSIQPTNIVVGGIVDNQIIYDNNYPIQQAGLSQTTKPDDNMMNNYGQCYGQADYVNYDSNWGNIPEQNLNSNFNKNSRVFSLIEVNTNDLMNFENDTKNDNQVMDIPNSDLILYDDVWNNTQGNQSLTHQFQQNMDQNSQNNSYSNIGQILTNLELIGNHPSAEQNYDIKSMPYDPNSMKTMLPAVVYTDEINSNLNNINHFEHSSSLYDYSNSQNHTLTDISHTFLKETPRDNLQVFNNTASNGTPNNFVVDSMNQQQQLNDLSLNENVVLPSLVDYLQHPFDFL